MRNSTKTQPKSKDNWLDERIANVLVDSLKGNKIEVENASAIAKYVLERKASIKDEQTLLDLLTHLADMYNGFEDLLTVVEGLFARKQEKQVVDQVLQLIKTGDTDKAVDLANQYIEK